MADRRPTNAEQHLQKLEEEEAQRQDEAKGILEIFGRDADEPLSRGEPDE